MSLKRRALTIAADAGYEQYLLQLYDRVNPLLDGKVDRAVREMTPPSNEQGTILFPLLPAYQSHIYRSCILAHAFQRHSYTPLLLRDDGDLPVWFGDRARGEDAASAALAEYRGATMPKQFGFDTVTIGDALPDGYSNQVTATVADAPEDYHGVPVADLALASTRKYFKRYEIDLNDPEQRDAYLDLLNSGCMVIDACRTLFENEDVRAVITHEPAYIHGGGPLAIAHQHGIPAYSQQRAYRDETLIFGRYANQNALPQFTDKTTIREALQTDLTEEQRATIDDIMVERASGGGRVQYSATTGASVSGDSDSQTVGMFTNLIWDASLEVEDAPFPDVLEWIGTTIDALGGREDVQLVVKTHPAESMLGTNQSVSAWISDRYDGLPANVELLNPETNIDTYELIGDLDAGVVYNSTVGLEMAYEGVPVIVAGDTHYRGLGFTVDPDTKAEYHNLLESITDVEAPTETQALAQRYAYFLFVQKHVQFPWIRANAEGDGAELQPVSDPALSPAKADLDRVVRQVVADDPVVRPVGHEPVERSLGVQRDLQRPTPGT